MHTHGPSSVLEKGLQPMHEFGCQPDILHTCKIKWLVGWVCLLDGQQSNRDLVGYLAPGVSAHPQPRFVAVQYSPGWAGSRESSTANSGTIPQSQRRVIHLLLRRNKSIAT